MPGCRAEFCRSSARAGGGVGKEKGTVLLVCPGCRQWPAAEDRGKPVPTPDPVRERDAHHDLGLGAAALLGTGIGVEPRQCPYNWVWEHVNRTSNVVSPEKPSRVGLGGSGNAAV